MTKHNKTTKAQETGATIVETLAVLGVIGCISIGMVKGISAMHEKVKIQKAQEQVDHVINAMRDHFTSYLPSSDLTADKLLQIGVFKEGEVVSGKAYNVYGSEMTLEVVQDTNPYFTFTYKDMGTKLCVDLLQGNWGNDSSTGLMSIELSGASTAAFYWDKGDLGLSDYPLPPSFEDSIEACKIESDEFQFYSISWSYYL